MKNQKNTINKIPVNYSPVIAGTLLTVFIVLSLWLIFEYAAKERERDLAYWQSRLALLAELRATTIEDWFESKKNELHELALNPSLRLYLSEYVNKNEVDNSILQGQQGHVRNLLLVSASRFGINESVKQNSTLNLNQSSDYGIAILGAEQQLVMSSKGFPVNIEQHKKQLQTVYETATAQIIDFYKGKQQQPVYGYVVPVFQIQDSQLAKPVGAVMLLLDPRTDLYRLLENRQSATTTDESLLVRQSGPALTYVSPLQEGYKLFHQLPDNNNSLASSYAFHNPGGFVKMKDYRANDVLVTGRIIKNSPWRLVQKISAEEALSESNRHQKFLLSTFSVFVLFVAAAFIAIWRHSTSLRLQALSEALETRTELLDAVTDNIRDNIVLTDESGRVIFINATFAQTLGLGLDELKGKHLSVILGQQISEQLTSEEHAANNVRVMPLLINNNKRVYHVTATRLMTGEHKGASLYVLHDISELKSEQDKREKLGRGIISTLVKAVDLHDPFCANHSERTREVALEIGKEIGLSELQLESLEMAALLANIGKLFVPKDVLTKMGELTQAESDELKKHIQYAVEILSELSFNGPVVDIIAQKNERMDGSGYPAGLTEDKLLTESKILAVANAFVAMASSRAYRAGRNVNEVVDILLQQSESKYDRHVVAALFHIAENKSDWKTWQVVKKED